MSSKAFRATKRNEDIAAGKIKWEQTAVETVPPMAVVVFSLLVCELLLWFINSAKPLCDKLIVLSPPSEYNLKPLREA